MGLLFKSGTDEGVNMTFTSGGCAYNIWKNGKFGVRVKGINGVKFYNNTFYNEDGKRMVFFFDNCKHGQGCSVSVTGTKIFNNIFYSTIQIPMIKIESGCLLILSVIIMCTGVQRVNQFLTLTEKQSPGQNGEVADMMRIQE